MCISICWCRCHFVETEDGAPDEFHELPRPSDERVANLVSQIARRATRLLERR
jgi:hypothetical protein